jgi:hypothetical protein
MDLTTAVLPLTSCLFHINLDYYSGFLLKDPQPREIDLVEAQNHQRDNNEPTFVK